MFTVLLTLGKNRDNSGDEKRKIRRDMEGEDGGGVGFLSVSLLAWVNFFFSFSFLCMGWDSKAKRLADGCL